MKSLQESLFDKDLVQKDLSEHEMAIAIIKTYLLQIKNISPGLDYDIIDNSCSGYKYKYPDIIINFNKSQIPIEIHTWAGSIKNKLLKNKSFKIPVHFASNDSKTIIIDFWRPLKESLKESLFDSKTQTMESLFNKDLVQKDIMYHPKTKNELFDCIEKQLDIQGPDANLNIIDVSKITDMRDLFEDLYIRNIDISNWDVSKVEDMNFMFYNCSSFNSDLSKWDVRNVEYMSGMFNGCKKFNSDLSKWDIRKVEDISYMFDGCKNFNCDLSKWDVRNVKHMNGVFYNCSSFNSDLSKWDVRNVEYMNCMFYNCKSLKKIPNWYHEES